MEAQKKLTKQELLTLRDRLFAEARKKSPLGVPVGPLFPGLADACLKQECSKVATIFFAEAGYTLEKELCDSIVQDTFSLVKSMKLNLGFCAFSIGPGLHHTYLASTLQICVLILSKGSVINEQTISDVVDMLKLKITQANGAFKSIFDECGVGGCKIAGE